MTLTLFNATRVLTGTATLATGLDATPWMTRAAITTQQTAIVASEHLAEMTPRMGDALVHTGHEAGLVVAEQCLRLATMLLGGG